jgi:hypothetical protein
MKYDVDSFLAREISLMQDEKCQILKGEDVHQIEGGDKFSLTSLQQTFTKYEKKADDFMDKIRTDYADITLIECIVYANLVVFSLAATVAYLFYQPPNMETNAKKHAIAMKPPMINLPVNFENMKVPKKQIKKSLKKQVNEKNTTENML